VLERYFRSDDSANSHLSRCVRKPYSTT